MKLPGPLVDADWLRERLREPGLVVADVRWVPDGTGRAVFESGHIPGAVYLDIDEDLASPAGGAGLGRHPLPSPSHFARTMTRAGIGDDDAVVCYDAARGSHAARLWWMLAVTGGAAALLDGGLEAWTGPLEKGAARRSPAPFTERPWPAEAIADAEAVVTAIREGSGPVLDARAPERYRGEVEPIDARAGHIPGARSAPWTANLDERGRFLPPEELRQVYESLGVGKGGGAVSYCGSGVTACADAFAMERAGLGRPRVYVGSWSEWIGDPERPIATGPEP